MKYILVIMMFAYYSGSGSSPAITTQEFDSMTTCQKARISLMEDDFLGWSSGAPYIDARCFEK